MNDPRLELLADLNRKQMELEDVRREKQRLNARKKEIYRSCAQKGTLEDGRVKSILTRYALDIKERTDQINQLNEQIFAMKNGW